MLKQVSVVIVVYIDCNVSNDQARFQWVEFRNLTPTVTGVGDYKHRPNTDGNKQHLQNDLDRLVKWSEKWQMLFNFGKCKCLHTGHGNLNVNYKMGDTVLGTTVKEKGLGVTISADMKVSEQCGIAASKGNQILGLIRRNITYKGKKLIIPLYKGHEVKLVKDQCRLDIRKHSFSQRTINEWNKLSTDCVTASSMTMFKNKVDTYLRRAVISR